ncbi:hypothetical protein QYM36_004324 [Artemia franciscana]|uniref:Uncharacterized protein n=2 Tax=Artemia franciscana TaxID=6661 RepID=A0AA88LCI5_ARTSF|nr:hypothetical protein QYM36_004324 [Artemia franciscana]
MIDFPRGFPPPTAMPPPLHLLHQTLAQQHLNQKADHHHNHRQRYDSYGYDEDVGEDEYNGLMSRREKQWLINLINTQHLSDNPYVDDFYNTVYRLRQQKRQRDHEREKELQKADEKVVEKGLLSTESIEVGKFILPQNKNKEDSKSYSPLQFANSLGKIQYLTVAAPRRLIDVDRGANMAVHETTGQKEARRHKQLLLDIERLFSHVFALEDWNKFVEAPLIGNTSHHEQLATALASVERLTSILSLRKGKNLVARACPFLPKEQKDKIVRMIFSNLDLFKRDHSDPMTGKLVTLLIEEIRKLENLEDALNLANATCFTNNNLTVSLSNKVGLEVCLTLVAQGETLQKSEISQPNLDLWNGFVRHLSDELLKLKSIPHPVNLSALKMAGLSPSTLNILENKFTTMCCS